VLVEELLRHLVGEGKDDLGGVVGDHQLTQ
jgi:hypothetical protein